MTGSTPPRPDAEPGPTTVGRQLRRVLANLALCFVIIPGMYVLTIVVFERHRDPWYAWPLYYVFTVPSWPLVLLAVPGTELAVRKLGWSSRLTPRAVAVIAATLLAGVPVAIIAPGIVAFYAAAGALYGRVCRLGEGTSRRASAPWQA